MLRSGRKKIFTDLHSIFCFSFFVLTLLIGLFTFRHYGLSWDEPVQRELGLATWDYVTGTGDRLHLMINQYHNPGFELIEILPEKIFKLKKLSDIYYSRHLINFLIFWTGSLYFYLLARRTLKNKWLALMTVLMLYLTPRIFAHTFYNSKDIPLMVFFIISSYCVFNFFRKMSFKSTFLLALVSGFLFGIRIIGILIPLFVIVFFLLNIYSENFSKHHFKYIFIYLLMYCLFAFISYPVLWNDPIVQLITAFHMMSHFPFDGKVLFMGKTIFPQDLPWYYIPVWMGITIPLFWLLAFIVSLPVILLKTSLAKKYLRSEWLIWYIMAWCIFPFILVLLLNTPLYDEWRHLFFIYPAFLIIAVYGIRLLFQNERNQLWWKNALQFLVIICFSIQAIITSAFMIRNHPYEFVYFNILAGKEVGKKFDLDYWGLSYRAAFKYLLKNPSSEQLKVCWENNPGEYNLIWLSDEERKRLLPQPFDSCNYFLTNYRYHPESYGQPTWFSIKVNGNIIMAIQKLK